MQLPRGVRGVKGGVDVVIVTSLFEKLNLCKQILTVRAKYGGGSCLREVSQLLYWKVGC